MVQLLDTEDSAMSTPNTLLSDINEIYTVYVLNNNKWYISKEWLDLYTSWNYNFIYNNGPCNDCFPFAGICLFNSLKHAKNNLWIDNRLYTLYLSTILASNDILFLDKEINKEFRDEWNKLNLKYIKELL